MVVNCRAADVECVRLPFVEDKHQEKQEERISGYVLVRAM